MAKIVELDWNPSPDTLRRFGWIALAGFSLVALVAWQEWLVFALGLGAARPYVAGAFLGLAVLCGIFSALAPRANRPIYLGLALVSFPIGLVLSHVILGALFYGLITPIGLALRLVGRDALTRRFEPDADSYWNACPPARSKASYFKQY